MKQTCNSVGRPEWAQSNYNYTSPLELLHPYIAVASACAEGQAG